MAGLQAEVEVVALVGEVAEAVVALLEVHQVVRQAVVNPEVLLLSVNPVDPVVHQVVCQEDFLEVPLLGRKDHYPATTGLVGVQVLALAFWGGPAWAGFLDLLLVDTAGGVVATVGRMLLVEMVLSTRQRTLPW